MGENKEYISQSQEQGNIHISEDVVSTVAAMAAVEVDGVAGLSNLGADIAGIAGKKSLSKGVRLSVEDNGVVVELSILVQYGASIRDVGKAVQEAVISNVESVTGLKVERVNVHVSGVSFENGKG